MMGVGYICHWAIIADFQGKSGCFVSGLVYGHPKFEDGTFIYTSNVVAGDDNSFVTRSGSCYSLAGRPERGWADIFRLQNPDFDQDKPFESFLSDACKK